MTLNKYIVMGVKIWQNPNWAVNKYNSPEDKAFLTILPTAISSKTYFLCLKKKVFISGKVC